ncbi:MAG: hypothetical protein ACRDQZ_16665 [Mycobacteriales bacterium]
MNQQVTLREPTAEEIAQAKLPARYEAARTAIAECDRIDELKDLADKQAALASYARLSKDTSLHQLALRIQSRAIRRAGELLKQIPRGDEATRYGQDGAVPPVTRTQAADDAGLSERQRKTALQVASVPADDFERQVESETPPTVTRLATLGRSPRDYSQPRAVRVDVNRVISVTIMNIHALALAEPPAALLELDLREIGESDAADWAAMLIEALPILVALRDRLLSRAKSADGAAA